MKGIFIVLIAFWGATSTVSAAVPAKYLGQKLPLNATIASYNKSIASGRLQGTELARLYWERGIQYAKLRHFELAEQDYTYAIEKKSDYLEAYIQRASVRTNLQKYVGAYEDFNRALSFDPSNKEVFKLRGAMNFVLGKFTDAANDYRQYLHYQPDDLYRIAWLFLSEKYDNKQSETSIRQYVQGLDLNVWPGAILKLYMGDVSLKEIVNALNTTKLDMNAGHACEAYFYLGQYLLLTEDKVNAKRFFLKAVKTNATNYIEYEFAMALIDKL